ncbi:GIY-YIG nuclease family protein [Bacillus sp. OTU530]|uniref:GIY-YIG nuclease family protein n=1 Tax=Bacillus sp. OTU530 TaxID=3043862 RepID=UPI00313E8DB2
MFTEEELVWIREVFSDYDPELFQVAPSYFYKKETEYERNKNRENVRKELDDLRDKLMKVTPEELLELRNENKREQQGIENFSGIYIIHNCVKDIYYVGKAERVFDRAYQHFLINEGNPGVHKDYSLGDGFSISLIPLENTSFSLLNELEDNSIRAYDAFSYGYNRVEGTILDKPIFRNNDYEKVSDLILDRIKGTEVFSTLTNDKKRMIFILKLFKEFELPRNPNFQQNFMTVIKKYQKVNKKKK